MNKPAFIRTFLLANVSIFEIKLFSNLIDYDELRIKSNEIFKLSQNEKKIKNPHPEINYKNF